MLFDVLTPAIALKGLTRPIYKQYLDHKDLIDARQAQLIPFITVLVFVIVLKLLFILAFSNATDHLAQTRATDDAHRDGVKLLEEFWVMTGNIIMLIFALDIIYRHNGGCTFFSTDTCFKGWPLHDLNAPTALYYAVECAWYIHLLLKPVMGYGPKDGRDIMVHHGASLILILISFGFNLTRIGVLTLALFGFSNPLLHAAKICNQLSIKPLRISVFALFALVFLITRVFIVPRSVLYPAIYNASRDIPHAVKDFPLFYWLIVVLLVVLYVLQLQWFKGIVRVLTHAHTIGAEAASKLSAQVDPAKRYAAAHVDKDE